jgi:hypothetical protein
VKIEQMHDHKNQDDPSGVYHRLRAKGSAASTVDHSVALGPSLAVFQEQEQGKDNMKRENRKHREFKDGDQKSQAVQMVGVGEKDLPAQERSAVADNVDQDKQPQKGTAGCHQHFFANGRRECSENKAHDVVIPPCYRFGYIAGLDLSV